MAVHPESVAFGKAFAGGPVVARLAEEGACATGDGPITCGGKDGAADALAPGLRSDRRMDPIQFRLHPVFAQRVAIADDLAICVGSDQPRDQAPIRAGGADGLTRLAHRLWFGIAFVDDRRDGLRVVLFGEAYRHVHLIWSPFRCQQPFALIDSSNYLNIWQMTVCIDGMTHGDGVARARLQYSAAPLLCIEADGDAS